MADMVVGAHSAAGRVYHIDSNRVRSAAGGSNGDVGYISPASASRMTVAQNYATRPITPKEEDKGDA